MLVSSCSSLIASSSAGAQARIGLDFPACMGATVSGRPKIAAQQFTPDWGVVAALKVSFLRRRAYSLLVPMQVREKCLCLKRPFYSLSQWVGQYEADSSPFPCAATSSRCKVLLGASRSSSYTSRYLCTRGALVKALTGLHSGNLFVGNVNVPAIASYRRAPGNLCWCRHGARSEPCCSTNAMMQARGSRKSTKPSAIS